MARSRPTKPSGWKGKKDDDFWTKDSKYGVRYMCSTCGRQVLGRSLHRMHYGWCEKKPSEEAPTGLDHGPVGGPEPVEPPPTQGQSAVVGRKTIVPSDSFELEIPRGACFLHLGVVQGIPVMWYAHEQGAEQVPVRFHVVNDGSPIDLDLAKRLLPLATFHYRAPTNLVQLDHFERAHHLFVEVDPNDGDWTIGAALTKQIAPELPKQET